MIERKYLGRIAESAPRKEASRTFPVQEAVVGSDKSQEKKGPRQGNAVIPQHALLEAF